MNTNAEADPADAISGVRITPSHYKTGSDRVACPTAYAENDGKKETVNICCAIASQHDTRPAMVPMDVSEVDVADVAGDSPSSNEQAPRDGWVAGRRFRTCLSMLTYDRVQPLFYPVTLTLVVLLMTGWWVAGLILHRHDLGWIVPFLVWLAVCLRIIALHPPTRRRAGTCLSSATAHISHLISIGSRASPAFLETYPYLPLAVITASVIILGTFVPPDAGDNTRTNRAVSLFGLIVFLWSFYVTSRNRARVNFQAVLGGTMAQFILGLFVLKTKAGFDIFSFLGQMAKTLLGYSADGTVFLTSDKVLSTGWFLVAVVPAVIFFVAFMKLLHYWGWISWLVSNVAIVFTRMLGISGAEGVVAAASPFIGQGESAVLIVEYMPRLTRAEIHQIMTSGFATIAGSVMSAYMQMGISPVAIISSCVMSIPASVALSKLRYPETEEPVTGGRAFRLGAAGQQHVDMEEGHAQHHKERPYNALHALGLGAWLGIKIAGMIVASVLSILALLGLVDGLLGWWGSYVNAPQLTIQLMVGYLLYPVAFLLGVDRNNDGGSDLRKVAELLGIKIVANEFVAYGDLTSDPTFATLAPRSRLIAMYALCGFGNFSAVGIQIGALTQLAPRRAGDVTSVAFSALVTGIVATLTSATIAGMLMDNDELLPPP